MTRVARLLSCWVAAVAIDAAALDFPGAVPSIASDGQGGFVVSYIDKAKDSFRMVTIRDGKASASREIAQGGLLVNRADFPSIAMQGTTMLAHWSTGKGHHGRTINIARSTDGGMTWSAPRTPHPKKVSEFGFVALAPTGDAIWLDGRGLEGGMEGHGDMELHHSVFPFTRDEALDARVCDCCQTAMAMTSAGPIVAYRDRSNSEIRDISIIRRTAAGWTEPKPLHVDGWKLAGCPVNGPQLDARGRQVAAVWFTAAKDDPRVQVAFSSDAGETFAAPIRISSAKTTGHVDVALLADGSAIVSWLETRGGKTILMARRSAASGKLGKPLDLGEANGFPRMAVSKQNVGVVRAAGDRVLFTTIDLTLP